VVYLLIAVLLSSSATGLVAIQAAKRAQAESERRAEQVRIESDRRWCKLLGDLDGAYNDPPPKTQTGISVAAEIHRLRTEPQPAGFGCPR
jgi:hypothetical protein